VSILDTTIVDVAHMLSLATDDPADGYPARRFGAKQVTLTSLVLFTS